MEEWSSEEDDETESSEDEVAWLGLLSWVRGGSGVGGGLRVGGVVGLDRSVAAGAAAAAGGGRRGAAVNPYSVKLRRWVSVLELVWLRLP